MNPYPGLRPFSEAESAYFFGRELASARVEMRLKLSPLTVLYARSGVGKSSFLTCRLLPRLKSVGTTCYVNEWGARGPDEEIGAAVDRLLRSGDKNEKPILVLDQFEDVFKLSWDREPLWDRLAELVNIEVSPVHVLISMREEWIGAWAESEEYLPDALRSIVKLPPLCDPELVSAVLGPAEAERTVKVESGLPGKLIEDLRRPNAYGMGGDYVEPGLLQLVCHRLWEEAASQKSPVISIDLYQRLGGADQILRQFVWRQLGEVGPRSHFSAGDRVLWSGITRHLVLAQGVKALVTPKALSKKILMSDLGLAGAAVASKVLRKKDAKYLWLLPEKRDDPPHALVQWVERVLAAGIKAGFLKRQRGVVGETDSSAAESVLHELSHDLIGPILQQFVVEFEGWVRKRAAIVAGVLFGVGIVLPIAIVRLRTVGWSSFLAEVGFVTLGLGFYVLMFYVSQILIQRMILFPFFRALVKGRVPLPEMKEK